METRELQEDREVALKKKYLRYFPLLLPRKTRDRMIKEERDEKNSSSVFSKLPDELVHEIFSYLTLRDILLGASRVSRRFRRLCAFTSSELDLETVWRRNPWMGPTHFKQMVSLSTAHIRVLRLEPSYFFLERGDHQWDLMEVAAHALRHCPSLEMSRLDSKRLDVSSLKALRRHGGSLRKLTLLLDKEDVAYSRAVKDHAQINVRLICCAPKTNPSEQSNEKRKLKSFEIRTYFRRGENDDDVRREEVPQCFSRGTEELFLDGVTRKKYRLGFLGRRRILETLVVSSERLSDSKLQSVQRLPRIKELFVSAYWDAPFFGPREMASKVSTKLRQVTDGILQDVGRSEGVVKAAAELVQLSLDSVLIREVC